MAVNRVKEILDRATPSTILADTRALQAFGFPVGIAFTVLERAINARVQQSAQLADVQATIPVRVTRLHDWRRVDTINAYAAVRASQGEDWYDESAFARIFPHRRDNR